MRYRVELWIVPDHEGDNGNPDRMPDVNRVVTARDAERAKLAAYHRANRAACRATPGRWVDLEIESGNVFPETWPALFHAKRRPDGIYECDDLGAHRQGCQCNGGEPQP